MHPYTVLYFVLCICLFQHEITATVFPCNRTAACGCSVSYANINARIVGGEIATSHSWGWAVSLGRRFIGAICGGTIISPSFILTAAHCVKDDLINPGNLFIVVGADTLNGGQGQRLSVSRIYMHPRYIAATHANDIAILSLDQPINFQDNNVARLCLPAVPNLEQRRYPIITQPVVAIGWGLTSSGGSVSNNLRQVTVRTVDSSDSSCRNVIRDNSIQFCAGVRGGGKDTCQGDSGGPLMFYSEKEQLWVLAGITSYGIGCGLPNFDGVYTRVSRYIDWIQSIVGDDNIVTLTQSKANIDSMSILLMFTAILFKSILCNYH